MSGRREDPDDSQQQARLPHSKPLKLSAAGFSRASGDARFDRGTFTRGRS